MTFQNSIPSPSFINNLPQQRAEIQPELQPIASTITKEAEIIPEQPKQQSETQNDYENSFFDSFSKKIVNEKDINDTVEVPRSIFKGYLCFFLGTSTGAITGLIKGQNALSKTVKGAFQLATIALTSLGTFEFVKPYLIKQKEKTHEAGENPVSEKPEEQFKKTV